MSIDAINNNFQTGFAQAGTQAGSAESARGTFMGHTVSVQSSPASLLADAAEELGFSVDRTKDYELSRRKERESSDVGKKIIERYQQMMQQAGKKEQLEECVKNLKTLHERESMHKALAESFSDATDAWAALQAAIESFDNDPSVTDAQKAELKALADDFYETNGTAIKLGLQGALTGADFPDIGTSDETRDFYRQTVGEFSSVNEVFADIKREYGENIDRAMDFLFAALSSDIASDTPSMEITHLENVHAKLELVRLTQSAFKLCDEMMGRWENVHGQKHSPLKSMELLGDIVELRGKNYLGAIAIEKIAAKAKAPDPEYQVLFLQELLSTVRKFPVELFDDIAGRGTVMDAVQAAVDKAIDREDEWLASLE